MNRIDKNTYFKKMARLVAERSTCLRHKVGCVLVDSNYHILSTGYNGAPSGLHHCVDLEICSVPKNKKASDFTGCKAVHAEQNALLQCKDKSKIAICYVTRAPCFTCTKLLLNTPCQTIIFEEAHSGYEEVLNFWLSANRGYIWCKR